MKIMAVDQARNGAWSVFNYETKALEDCGSFAFGEKVPFDEFLVGLVGTLRDTALAYSVDAVFIEDTQCQVNINSFKKLCWLQGALIYWLKNEDILYDVVPPSRWQGFCNASGRSGREIRPKENEAAPHKKRSKALSIDFVRENYNVCTENDNLADAICIGHYVVHNVKLRKGIQDGKEERKSRAGERA